MPYPENKSENYTNFGGINIKTSPYVTDKNEFLNLQNVDFRTIGALSSFAGSTQFNTGPGATRPITGIAGFYPVSQSFPIAGLSYAIIAADWNKISRVTGTTFVNIYDSIMGPSLIAFTPYDFAVGDSLFGADSYDFITYQGFTTAWQYSLPKPYPPATNTFTGSGTGGGISGLLNIYFALVRQDGFVGPAILGHSATYGGITQLVFNTRRLNPNAVGVGISAGSFGISGVAVWYSLNDSSPALSVTLAPTNSSFTLPSGATTFPGFTTGLVPWLSTVAPEPEDFFGTFRYGFATDNGATGTAFPLQSQPACLEIYSNQLFKGGFPNAPDDVWYSQIGEYEKHELDGYFSVRANDGDVVSCMVAYFTQLVIFKTNTTHSLSGSDPDTFSLSETNTQYGCVSPNGACVWEQRLWFLDKKGICEYNGANTQIVSSRVEQYFQRMNLSAARYSAIMIHVKQRSEVWCAIPIDGSQLNNLLIVYDYVADAWTTRVPPVSITSMSNLNAGPQGMVQPSVFFGSSSGAIFNFGQSLLADNGANFTCVIKTRFHSDLGHSIEKMWRRLYLDALIPAGTTQNIAVNFYANQGVSPVLSTTMSLSQFQQRIDFGIPSKDLSVELIYNGGQFLQLNGYTLEYRFQRAT